MANAEPTSPGGQLHERLQELMSKAESLCARCSNKPNIYGTSKLRKKCLAELKFLQKTSKKGHLKEAHLASSNLSHLEGIVHAMESLPNVTRVLQPFQFSGLDHPLCVDIVCNHGFTWVKVIARKAQALHLVWAGEGQFGERSIVHQAAELVQCAEEWPLNFTSPSIVMIFLNGITQPVKDKLGNLGVHVQGTVQEVEKYVMDQLHFDTTSLSDSEEQNTFHFFHEGNNTNKGDDDDDDDNDDDDDDVLMSASEYLLRNTSRNCDSANSSKGAESPITINIDGGSSCDAEESVISEHVNVQTCDSNSGSGLPNVIKETMSDGTTTPSDLNKHESKCVAEQISSSVEVACSLGISNNELMRSDMNVVAPDVFSIRPDIQKVNLDITTLIGLVSNLCHGHSHYEFEEDILTQQACEERKQPLLPALEKFLNGKDLYACETAMLDFQSILDTVGGPEEKIRAETLLPRLHTVPDATSKRAVLLKTSAKIKERAKIIFGTGDTLQAVTASANSGFVRAAGNQGVTFAVFLHGPRALTEQKQTTATHLTNL